METAPNDLAFPAGLAEAAKIGFEWDEETSDSPDVDWEFYAQFEAPEETAWWFRLWTGNDDVDGSQFRFFGTTGAGDYAGFWLIRPGAPLTEQPIIYISSETDRGVVARNLGDLLWIFANGAGPAEAFKYTNMETKPNEAFRAIAERYAPGMSRSTVELVDAAQDEFPEFPELIESMCQ